MGSTVGWRAGLDSAPIDIYDDDQIAWLEALIWPGEPDRLANLRASLAIARREPPRILRGDLRADLVQLAAEAPRDANLVVFHTAVLAYIESREDWAAFARTVGEIGAIWVSNEAPGVFPEISAPRTFPRIDFFNLQPAIRSPNRRTAREKMAVMCRIRMK